MEDVWKELWSSSKVLCNYFLSYSNVVKDKVCIELGAGCSCLPSIVAVKLGALLVITTDKLTKETNEIEKQQMQNLMMNLTAEETKKILLKPIDWNKPEIVRKVINELESLDLIFGSDIFYDPEVFNPLIKTLKIIFKKFPHAEFIYAYENRNEWLIELEFQWNHLYRKELYSYIEDNHEVIIYLVRKMTEEEIKNIPERHLEIKPMKTFVGIEGGATHFKFVIIDENGIKLKEGQGNGLNLLLEGIEGASMKIATTLLNAAKEMNIKIPFESIGLGLAGAEDEDVNNKMIQYFVENYGDLCNEIHLTTDSVVSIAATFQKGGVVIIAGTGSSCRLLKEDGEVYGCGGWGHLIGDGGSGYWISIQAIQKIFDVEDRLIHESGSIHHLKQIVLKHFKIKNKLGLLDILYGNKFNKANIASLCEKLASEISGDPVIEKIFYDGGHIIGRHLVAISKNFDQGMYIDVPVLIIGSVWKSWNLIKKGFTDAVAENKMIKKVSFYESTESPAIGAAILAAQVKVGYEFEETQIRKTKPKVFDVISFN